MKRRDFVKYFGLGTAGPWFTNIFNYKKKTVEYLMPYVVPPDGVLPGTPNWYATTCRQCDAGCGIEVKVREGRAKKIEGNNAFPVNSGKVCARGQAGLQFLYNPDRIAKPLLKEKGKFKKISWTKAEAILTENLRVQQSLGKGDRALFLSQPLRGSVSKLAATFMNTLGSKELYSYEFLDYDPLKKANELAFGQSGHADYDINNAEYVLSFGAGLLDNWLSPVKQSVGYGEMRDVNLGSVGHRGHLTHFEPRMSLTASNADDWFPNKPGTEGLLALAIAHEIVAKGLSDSSIDSQEIKEWKKALKLYKPKDIAHEAGVSEHDIEVIAKEFAKAKGIALSGHTATAQEHGTSNAVAVNVLNYLVGSVGSDSGVRFSKSSYSDMIEPNLSYEGMKEAATKMRARKVDVLFIYNVNPVFNLPKDAGFVDAMKSVPFKVSFSSMMDETTKLADLVLPDSTYLESWGDYIPVVDHGKDSIGLTQPVVSDVYKTRQIGDTLLNVAKELGGNMAAALPAASFYEYLRANWTNNIYTTAKKNGSTSAPDFETFWNQSLKDGGNWSDESKFDEPAKMTAAVLTDLKFPEISKDESEEHGEEGEEEGEEHGASEDKEFQLLTYPAHGLFDGRGANLPWLQEMPEPMITGNWGTWVEINPKVAKELDLREGDIVEVESEQGKIEVRVYINQAISPDIIAIPLGQGHKSYGRYASGVGVNATDLMLAAKDEETGSLAWAYTPVKLHKTGQYERVVKTEPLLRYPGTEDGMRELERHLVPTNTKEEHEELIKAGKELKAVEATPNRDLQEGAPRVPWLYGKKFRTSKYFEYEYRWGMVIDLDKCTGCEACVVACNAENNIPMAGAKEIVRQRPNFWLRIDRYWEGEYPNIVAKSIPVLCHHCGNAPCEPVCPVAAPFHTNNGLNGQVYNRCMGTRLCAVNCLYKARVFNWYNHEWDAPLDKQLNSDVSVRWAGIMEKCSFCVQRLRAAKDIAKDDDRLVGDGEVQTACQQTCPSGAITFGNLMDKNSKVSKLTKSSRRFRMLEHWGQEPAIVFLKAVKKGVSEGGDGEAQH